MKGELDRKILTTFVGVITKTCRYLINDSREDKIAKAQKLVS